MKQATNALCADVTRIRPSCSLRFRAWCGATISDAPFRRALVQQRVVARHTMRQLPTKRGFCAGADSSEDEQRASSSKRHGLPSACGRVRGLSLGVTPLQTVLSQRLASFFKRVTEELDMAKTETSGRSTNHSGSPGDGPSTFSFMRREKGTEQARTVLYLAESQSVSTGVDG